MSQVSQYVVLRVPCAGDLRRARGGTDGEGAIAERVSDELSGRDGRGAAQRTARPLHAGRDARELVLGAGQQLGAFAGPLFARTGNEPKSFDSSSSGS